MGINISFALNIMPDHDSYATHKNYYEGKDWLKRQIHNSGNFVTKSALWTHLFGGINLQIVHHLFPDYSHMHYPKMNELIKKYAEDNNIPYVEVDTLWGVLVEFYGTLQAYKLK